MHNPSVKQSAGHGAAIVQIWNIVSWCLFIVLAFLGILMGFDYLLHWILGPYGFGIFAPYYDSGDPASIQACMERYISGAEHYKAILRTFTLAFASYIAISTVFVYPCVLKTANEPFPFKWYTALGMAVLFLLLIPVALTLMYDIMFKFGGSACNAWSHVFAAAVVAFIIFFIYTICRMKRSEMVMFKRRGISCFLLAAMAVSIVLFEYIYTFADLDRVPVEESAIEQAIAQCKMCATQYMFMTPILNLFFIVYVFSTLAKYRFVRHTLKLPSED